MKGVSCVCSLFLMFRRSVVIEFRKILFQNCWNLHCSNVFYVCACDFYVYEVFSRLQIFYSSACVVFLSCFRNLKNFSV